MGWKVYANPFETGELSNTAKFQTVKFVEDKILLAVRTWIVLYNNPTFTNLNMKIYSNDDSSGANTPGMLLATSTNTQIKSDIITLENGAREIWFQFDYFPVNGEDKYNFVVNGDGYTYSDESHIAWMLAWPDPVYSAAYTPTFENLLVAPYQLYAVGGDF